MKRYILMLLIAIVPVSLIVHWTAVISCVTKNLNQETTSMILITTFALILGAFITIAALCDPAQPRTRTKTPS